MITPYESEQIFRDLAMPILGGHLRSELGTHLDRIHKIDAFHDGTPIGIRVQDSYHKNSHTMCTKEREALTRLTSGHPCRSCGSVVAPMIVHQLYVTPTHPRRLLSGASAQVAKLLPLMNRIMHDQDNTVTGETFRIVYWADAPSAFHEYAGPRAAQMTMWEVRT